MPVFIFGFDQLARKYFYATRLGVSDTTPRVIPTLMLRADTPESFKALWVSSKARFSLRCGSSNANRLTAWNVLSKTVDNLRRHESSSDEPRQRVPAARVVDATATRAEIVSQFNDVLLSMPFGWEAELATLGERLREPDETTTPSSTNPAPVRTLGQGDAPLVNPGPLDRPGARLAVAPREAVATTTSTDPGPSSITPDEGGDETLFDEFFRDRET